MSECLELAIESAWTDLKARPMAVWLSARGKLTVVEHDAQYSRLAMVGRFTDAIPLAEFRGEVFHVWEGFRR